MLGEQILQIFFPLLIYLENPRLPSNIAIDLAIFIRMFIFSGFLPVRDNVSSKLIRLLQKTSDFPGGTILRRIH